MQSYLIELLDRHVSEDETERRHVEHARTFILENEACTLRSTLEGHVTASAWVLSPDLDGTLLTHHRKLDRWLQPGGHVDNDATIQQAALREAREESGIDALVLMSDALFDVDVHLIPEREHEPAHYHFDFRFLIHAGDADFSVSEESHELAWIPLDTLLAGGYEESIARMARKSAGFCR